MALMVKSRRARSAARLLVKRTLSGGGRRCRLPLCGTLSPHRAARPAARLPSRVSGRLPARTGAETGPSPAAAGRWCRCPNRAARPGAARRARSRPPHRPRARCFAGGPECVKPPAGSFSSIWRPFFLAGPFMCMRGPCARPGRRGVPGSLSRPRARH